MFFAFSSCCDPSSERYLIKYFDKTSRWDLKLSILCLNASVEKIKFYLLPKNSLNSNEISDSFQEIVNDFSNYEEFSSILECLQSSRIF